MTRLQGGTLPARPRLAAETMALPATADAYLIVDQAALPAMNFLIELGRFSGLLASAYVLDSLKQPTFEDRRVGQSESEQLTEIPFELTRLLGGFRIDQTCLAIRLPQQPSEQPQVTLHAAGRFEPKALEAMFAKLGGALAAIDPTLTDTGITVASKGMKLAPDEARAKALPDLEGFAVRLFMPAGSSLLARMRAFGVPPTESLDLRIGFGTHLRSRIVLTVPNGQERLVQRGTEEQLADLEERLGLAPGVLVMKFTPGAGTLVATTECAVDRLPTMAQLKQLRRSMLPARR